MKKRLLHAGLIAGANLSSSLTTALAGDGYANQCKAVGDAVAQLVSQDRKKVLLIVEDALSRNEGCACEIIKAAIVSSKANNKLVTDIVVTAIKKSEGMAAVIVECAVAVAPDAAESIQNALKSDNSVDFGSGGFAGGVSAAPPVVGGASGSFSPTIVEVSGSTTAASSGGSGEATTAAPTIIRVIEQATTAAAMSPAGATTGP